MSKKRNYFPFLVLLPLLFMWETLTRGAQVIISNFQTWLVIFVMLVVSTLICLIILLFLYDWQKLNIEVLSLSISGSPVFLTSICFLIENSNHWYSQAPLILILFYCIYHIAIKVIHKKEKGGDFQLLSLYKHNLSFYIRCCFLVILLIVLFLKKFAYIYGLQFPLNVDSVNHTNQISAIYVTNNLLMLPYYHYGFHYVILSMKALTGAQLPKLILIYGQFLQVMAPITLIYPIYKVTKNFKVALITISVAAFVLGMPSEATSWGKYPTLMSMVTIFFVFYILEKHMERYTLPYFFFEIAVFIIAIFIHSRMGILLISGFIILYFNKLIKPKIKSSRTYIYIVLINYCFLLIMFFISLVFEINSWNFALVPYPKFIIILAILLLPFSIFYYLESTITIEIFLFINLLFTLIRLPGLLDNFNTSTLIDRPFLTILIFIPLSILFGLGLAGLEKFTNNYFLEKNASLDLHLYPSQHRILPRHDFIYFFFPTFMGATTISFISKLPNAFIIFIAVISIAFPNEKTVKILPDVNYVSTNDLFLFQEIKNTVPANVKILIPNASPYYELGIDGGSWIYFATGRETIKMSYDINLASPITLGEICGLGVRYIYIGSKPYSFSSYVVNTKRDWYSPLIYYPDVSLYKLNGCSKNEQNFK